MYFETIKQLKDSDFKRLIGIQRRTFELMLKVVEKGLRDFCRSTKMSRADQLLMTLMYWREYRTEFQNAQSYVSVNRLLSHYPQGRRCLSPFKKVLST